LSAVAPPPVMTTLLPGFEGTSLPAWLKGRLRAGLGGVCLFGQNIVSFQQLRTLTDAIYAENPRALIAIDEEGGDVTRLFHDVGSPWPGNAVLGRIDDLASTRNAARQVGWELRRAGCNVNFAPSVDVNSNAENPVIGVRSFGVVAERVAQHGAAWITGLQSTGIAASAKHFPGHGDTAQDSHVSLPVVDRTADELRHRELLPFVAAINAGSRLVMTSHILLPQIDAENPATMSHHILVGLLREELGFSGVIVSDALDMAGAHAGRGIPDAAVRAMAAGCDLLCLGTENTDEELIDIEHAVSEAIASGILGAERVHDGAERVQALASDLLTSRPAIPEPSRSPITDGWPGDELELIKAFDVQPATWKWRTRPSARYSVVRLESNANIAIGTTPWGPFAEVARDPRSATNSAFAAHPQFEVTPTQPAPALSPDEAVLIIGRDIHRHAFARAAVDRLRDKHAYALVVDMGWPSDDRRYAGVATFGASRVMGKALLTFLAREEPPRATHAR
jgi:beta-N-acetylhexosaminidase